MIGPFVDIKGAVDVHVHWLRSRIEVDPANPEFLHTVRGTGYVFRRPT